MSKVHSLKNTLKGAAIMLTLMIAMISCDQEKVLSPDDYPSEITSYVSTNFPDNTILQVVKDSEGISMTYDVLLSENINLEFNRKKEIIEIKAKSKLPNSVIPEKILQHVSTNYPDNFITSWELDDGKQQVKINNGLELEFDKNMDFLKLD